MSFSGFPCVLFALLWLVVPLARAATVTASFTSAATVPVTEFGYYASGNDVKISLGFAPPRGTALTVVKNTGIRFISGRFSNLEHGQFVKLAYGGTTYRFVANYYGGTGNDLVLQWAFQTPFAWGDNSSGQLGNNSTTMSKVPVAVRTTGVLSGKTVLAVAAGYSHSLALCSDGTLAAWGSNSSGELGNGSTASSSSPVLVNSGALTYKTVVAIAAGAHHSLALCSDGSVATWGYNGSGQLGSPAGSYSTLPVGVTTIGALSGKFMVAVAGGDSHSLALCSDGTMVAWGANSYGQLGNGTLTQSNAPVLVTTTGLNGKSVVSIAAGSNHSLALCSDGSPAAWGDNGYGQLGTTAPGLRSLVPVLTTRTGGLSGKTVTGLSGGSRHSLACNSDGTLAAWGNNAYGQLGNGTTNSSTLAVAVSRSGILSGKSVTGVAAGSNHGLAVCSDGTLASWGDNGFGQLGNNTLTDSLSPVAVTSSGKLLDKTPVAVAAGTSHGLAIAASAVSNPNNESQLTGLKINGGILFSPSFTSGHTAYQTTVPSSTAAIQVTATLANPSAILKINGTTATSGKGSASIPLAYGFNVVNVLVTAPDGITNTTYFITVTRTPLSKECSLASLTVSSGTVSPSFSPATTSYTATVPHDITAITLTPAASDPAATVKVNGSALASGATSPAIPLAVGNNTLGVRVTAQDGVTATTYTISLNRAASPGSLLTGLSLDGGTLSPAFKPGVLTYSAAVPGATSSVTLLPAADDGSNIKVNGIPVISGTSSQPVNLAPGNNAIAVEVAGITTYTVNVVRPSSVNFVYTSLTDIPASFPAFDATGLTANLALGFAPAVGATLTVVRNTGVGFITGRFGNIGHGQQIDLAYQGTTWRFVADYYGGTGNDLVLHWATQGICSWGYNAHGELGNNTTTDSIVPVNLAVSAVLDGKTVVMASASGSHNIALCSDGSMATWGYNSFRQLGDGSNISRSVPVAVTVSPALAGKTVVAVAASYFSLALCSDGTVVSWGSNSNGQLGNGDNTNNGVPRAVIHTGVLAGKTVVAVAAGGSHSLVLCSDGSLVAWGNNSSGQLGNGNTANSSVPVAVNTSGVLADKTVIAIAAGAAHSLALCSDGTLVAWGNNSGGQFGNGGTNNSTVPVPVDCSGILAGKSVISLQAGTSHSIVHCADGTVATWGDHFFGQLGIGTADDSNVPVAINNSGVLAGKSVVSVTAGNYHNFARCSDGTLAAWGTNGSGELGNGGTTQSNSPVAVNLTGALSGKTVQALSAGGSHTLALTASRSSVSALSAIGVSPGSLNQAFSPTASHYTAVVPATASSVTVTPVAMDSTATTRVNGITVANGSTTAIPLGSGTTLVTVLVTAQDGVATSSYTVSLEKSDYAAWLAVHPALTDLSASGDPDHDGIPNLLEYVLNSEPGTPSPSSLPTAATDADHFLFTFRRRADSALETSQVFQFSTTIGDWTNVSITAPTDPKVTLGAVDPDGTQAVTVTLEKSTNSGIFGRLQVTRP